MELRNWEVLCSGLLIFFFVTNIVAMFLTFPRVVSGMAGNLKDSG